MGGFIAFCFFASIIGVVFYLYIYLPAKTRSDVKKMTNARYSSGQRYSGKMTGSTNGSVSLMNHAKSLCDKREIYLTRYQNDVEYQKLENAFNALPTAYNRWAIDILGTPQVGKKPINPYAAGGAGYAVGGIVGGVAMGLAASNEQDKYEQRLKLFNSQLSKIYNSGEKVAFLVDEIDSIIERSVIPAPVNKKTASSSVQATSSVKAAPDSITRAEEEKKKKQKQDNKYRALILCSLEKSPDSSVKDIISSQPELKDLSSQKCAFLLRKLCEEGIVKVSDDRKYTIADEAAMAKVLNENKVYPLLMLKYSSLSQKDKKDYDEQVKSAVLDELQSGKWLSSNEIKQGSGKFDSVSLQKINSTLKKLEENNYVKVSGDQYKLNPRKKRD